MGIYHKFRSSRSDAGGSTKIQPSHWNAVHKGPQTLIWTLTQTTSIFWYIPDVKTEFAGGSASPPPYSEPPNARTRYDFTFCTKTRLSCTIKQDAAQGSIKMEYSADAVTWADISNSIAVDAVADIFGTDFNIPTAAKKLVWLRVVGFGGRTDGTGPSAEFGSISLYTI